ncbi:hypothetical protein CK203_066713 [Vitis vinifera]|uniref:Uncharacterized protein n=1 Tax=Vitis vinifera TaxID=29760 RepID=A0A438EVJ6_VITVI|nr:hypothetical protein CK203_066713 [Vitis vinifera]
MGESSKEAWVVDLWHHSKERCVWTPTFSRRLNDWEIKVVEHFLARLQEGRQLKVERTRCVGWKQSGTFSIKSLYSSMEVGRLKPFLVGIVWNAWVPPKVSFFHLEGNLGKSFDS